MQFPWSDTTVRDCPKDCGIPITDAQTATGPATVHTGTWTNKCTPQRKEDD